MGTWGTGVFQSDLAADVRDDYREFIAEGIDGSAAADELLRRYGGVVDDPDDAPDFWIGLAVAQYDVGRLKDRVRDRALGFVDGDGDVRRFAKG